jgi:hypothetical protein
MTDTEVSVALAHLLGGPVYAEDHPGVWSTVATKTAHLRDHLTPFGLRLLVDDVENYAYLRTFDELPEGMPRLFRRHKLTFGATILLILLRRHLATAESDAVASRIVVTTAEMVEWLTLYHPECTSPDKIATDVAGVERLGYLRKLRGHEDTFEIRRIVKAVVTSDWIAAYGTRLLEHSYRGDTSSRPDDEASDFREGATTTEERA